MFNKHTFENLSAFFKKTGFPKFPGYSEEDNRNDVGDRMMYQLHYTGVKLMDLKKTFGIKDATNIYIHCTNIPNDTDMH